MLCLPMSPKWTPKEGMHYGNSEKVNKEKKEEDHEEKEIVILCVPLQGL